MNIVIVGIDLGMNSCSLAGLYASGRVVLRHRMRRSSLESFVDDPGVAPWRWRRAATRTIWAVPSPHRGTTFD
jgi:hypothetical protein